VTTPTTVKVQLKLRQDTSSGWSAVNPILLAGELGRESNTGKIKIGDDSTAWNSLAYQPFGALITNADISATAEIAVSKLADGAARQLLQTDTAGTGVEWTSNVDVPGTLDVTSTATFDSIAQHPLGTAGAPTITFTGDANSGIYSPGADQVAISTNGTGRLFVDASGNVGIGTTSPGQSWTGGAANVLEVNQGTAGNTTVLRLRDTATSGTSGDVYLISSPSATATLGNLANGPLTFYVNNGEAARFDSSKRLLVGTSTARANFYNSTVSAQFQVEGSSITDRIISLISSSSTGSSGPAFVFGKQNSGAVGGNTVVASNDNLGNITFQGSDGTEFVEAASITAFVDSTPGANDMPGRLVFSTTADGASSPTERMRINSAGAVSFGTTSSSPAALNVQGIAADGANGYFASSRDGNPCASFNRKTNDGDIVDFRQDGVVEGTISVSGSTISYNGAHLSRWSQLSGGANREEILRGTVLSNIDEMCEWGEEDNEQLNRMKVSDVEGDPNVAGVFQAWDDDDDTYTDDFYCAMTGDFIIRIAEATVVQRGDLLMSAGDGTAKPQDDDIIRSKTIAKVTSTHVTCTYNDGSYCVPCVLMAC
jgi:hypothetical protein